MPLEATKTEAPRKTAKKVGIFHFENSMNTSKVRRSRHQNSKGIIHKNSYGGTIPVFWSLKTELTEILTINPFDLVEKIRFSDLGLNWPK